MTSAAQNIKRMVKLLSKRGPKNLASAALYSASVALMDRFMNFIIWLFGSIKKITG